MSARRQTIINAEPSSNKTRVLIVDDHPMTRSGLAYLINYQPDMATCFEAQNAAEALEGVLRTKPDLVLTDFTLPGKNGLELIKDIRAVRPDLPILVISMHEESLYAERVLRAGARGYITKEEGGEKLMRAIRHVLSGTIYVSDKMSAQILEIFSGGPSRQQRSLVENLTDREFEIFELFGQGLSTQQIATRLGVSMKTVSAHRANMKESFNCAQPTS
jgi:DNA-binding NarL/FixJ family response regulator